MDGVIEVTEERFGTLPDEREVKIFTLTNAQGLRARVTEYGAILVSVETPDRSGKTADVTLGYDTLEGWLGNSAYLGATIGRFGNRIAGGAFELDGKRYTLATNNSPGGIPCHLHGGIRGFDKVLWTGRVAGNGRVEFSYVSPDGEEGYPGSLEVKVSYTLTNDNELKWEAVATTDAPTVVNLVHHSYWNLSGDPARPIADHELRLAARGFLPTDEGQIPTGEIRDVAGTAMDFTLARRVGERIDDDDPQLAIGGGYDHCWVLDPGDGVRLAARLREPESGRVMEVLTDQPGVQFYSGNSLDGSVIGKNGIVYPRRGGLCLETQGLPDAPNQPAFPSPVLRPGETYRHVLIHRFSAD